MTTERDAEDKLRAELIAKIEKGNPLLDEAAYRKVLAGCKTEAQRAYLTLLYRKAQELVHDPKNDWDEILNTDASKKDDDFDCDGDGCPVEPDERTA